MKKINIYVLIVICCIILILVGCSQYPSKYPRLKISGDNVEFEGTVNGADWINEECGSSSDLGYWDVEVAKNIKPASVKSGDILNLTYIKNIQYFKVFKVEGSNKDNQKLIDVTVKNYKIHVPTEKGQYIYAVKTCWDSKHGVDYVFKIDID